MSLEALLDDLHARKDQRMYADNKRALSRGVEELAHHELERDQSYAADDVRAALGYRAIAQKDRGRDAQPYSSLATQLEDHMQNPYDDSSRTAITILKSSPATYKTRFEEITAHLENGFHYTDALLCREHLRQDGYVRRRARTHDGFRARRHEMLAELDEYISACREEMRPAQETFTDKAKRWGFRASAAAWTATMAYAAMPLDWLV